MTIEEMQLAPVAKTAATIMKRKHPDLVFTSGLRTVRQQAHAMAANIVSPIASGLETLISPEQNYRRGLTTIPGR